jgi:hypothetical protein
VSLTILPLGECVQAIGGNADLAITAACLKQTQKVNPSQGPTIHSSDTPLPAGVGGHTFTSTGAVSANGVTFTPAPGDSLKVVETTGQNGAEEFTIQGVTHDVSFESATLDGGNTAWKFSQKASGGYASSYTHGGGSFVTTSAPVPGSSSFNDLPVASATLPTFQVGKATTDLTLKLPDDLGGATGAQPFHVTNGTLASAVGGSAQTPLIATGASALDDAQHCGTALAAPVPSGPGSVTIDFTNISYHGLHLEALPGVQGGGITIAGPGHYIGKLQMGLPFPASDTIKLSTVIEIYQGRLRFGCAEGTFNPPASLPSSPVGVSRANFGFVSGNGSRDVFGSITMDSLDGLVHEVGNVALGVPASGSGNPWTLHVDGSLTVASKLTVAGALNYSSVGYINASGHVDPVTLLPATVLGPLVVSGAVDPRGAFLFEGSGGATFAGYNIASADALFSRLGYGACGSVGPVSVGYTATWGGDFDFFTGCDDLSRVRQHVQDTCQHLQHVVDTLDFFGLAQAALAAHDCVDVPGSARVSATGPGGAFATLVKKHTRRLGFVFTGSSAPPKVTLRDTHGRQIHTPAVSGPTDDARARAVLDPSTKRTLIEVANPAAGDWFASVDQGSSPVASFGVATPLGPPSIKATVRGGRHSRTRRLRYRIRKAEGRTVTFFEQFHGSADQIGKASGSRGTLRFTPGDGPAGRRRIVALISRNGLPEKRLVVTSYRARGPKRLSVPRRLSIRRSGSGAVVSFRKVRGARAYTVKVQVSDGRSFKTLIRKRRLRIPALGPGTSKLSVQVNALDSAGRSGAAGRKHRKLRRRPPRLKHPGKRG